MSAVDVASGNAVQLLPDFPQALLPLVLSHLSARQLVQQLVVSKRWREAAELVLSQLQRFEVPGHQTAHGLIWLGSTRLTSQVKHLHASGTTVTTGLAFLVSSQLGTTRLGQLISLHIDTCKQLRDEQLGQALQLCPQLRSLSLTNCGKLTDTAVVLIAQHCPDLQQLHLRDIYQLYDDVIGHLAQHCRQLTSLVLDGCVHLTSACLDHLARHCPQLQHLSTSRCCKLRNTGLQKLALGCPNLQRLLLTHCFRLTEVSCLAALPLVELNLNGMPQVVCSELTACLAGGMGASLRVLNLDGCTALKADVLHVVAAACPGLQALDVSRLRDITDAHVVCIAAACKRLQAVSMVWCSQVTDASLCRLVEANPGLKELQLEACFLLTDDSLHAIAAHARGVTSLNIRMCNSLTARGIAALVDGLHALEVLQMSGVLQDQSRVRWLVTHIKAKRPHVKLAF